MQVPQPVHDELILYDAQPSLDCVEIIEKSKIQLTDFYGLIKSMRKQGLNTDEIIKEIESELNKEKNQDGMSLNSMLRSIVMGYDLYFQRKEREV